jgi:hypothetical protein
MRNAPRSRQQNIVVQRLNGELLIYDLVLNKALCLNEASALVWEACDGQKSISEITKIVNEKLKTKVNEDFVWLALDRLKKENLIVNPEEISLNFDGLTRREVIRRIGFSSLVALPVVTSLIAPSAASAQSGATCNGPCQCSGLLSPVTVCPPGFAECAQGCNCVVSPGGCVQGEGTIFCNGTCTSVAPPPTCPVGSPGDCTCPCSTPVNSTCPTIQCAGGCSACRRTNASCFTPEVGPPFAQGVCQ